MKKIFGFLVIFTAFFCMNYTVIAQNNEECDYDNEKAIALFKKAEDLYKTRKYNDSGKLLREIIEKYPDYGQPYYYLGMLSMRKTNTNVKAAQMYFEKLVALCPDYDYYPYFHLADFYYDLGKYDSCITAVKVFLSHPDDVKSDEEYRYAEEMLDWAQFMNKLIKNKVPFNPVLVEGVSSGQKEYSFSISPDNSMIFYTRKVPADNVLTAFGMEENLIDRMMVSYFNGTKYDDGEIMESPFDKGNIESLVSLTADNSTMYCTKCQQTKKGNYYNCDIYLVTKDEFGNWLEPITLGDKINGEYTFEAQPCISADGKTLYFISDREGGLGGSDIYVSTKSSTGEWSTPRNLGAAVNTNDNERTPFIHSDGKSLYFASNGWKTVGETDLFYTRLDSKKMKIPINLGVPINDENDQFSLMISFDGTKAFLPSDYIQDKDDGDLYSFELYKEVQPEKTLVIYGKAYDTDGQILDNTSVELLNIKSQKIYKTTVDKETGRFILTTPFDSSYLLKAFAEGYEVYEQEIELDKEKYNLPAKVTLLLKKK